MMMTRYTLAKVCVTCGTANKMTAKTCIGCGLYLGEELKETN